MSLGGILATQLNTAAAHPWGLFVAGVDVIVQPGGGYGTPIDAVKVTSRGPTAPGSMSWTIEDPSSSITVSEGDEVRLHNFTTDRPVFYGFVTTVTYRPRPGSTGQDIVVDAIDVDVVLDWMTLPADFIVPALAPNAWTTIQALAASCLGVGVPLRAFAQTVVDTASSQSLPIQALIGIVDQFTIAKGTSLRDALRQLADAMYFSFPITTGNFAFSAPSFMVDEYQGLRVWGHSQATNLVVIPSDWASVTVTDTSAGPVRAEGLQHTLDGVGVVRTLVLIGLDFIRTYTDGTGRPGRTVVVTNTALTSAMSGDYVAAWAANYIAGFAARFRGTIPLQDWTPTVGAHVGGLVVLTDSNTGATGTYVIGQIDRSYNDSNRENWTITYGGIRASATAFVRRLTRATLN